MSNNYCVYMHENKTNGKKYIGITGKNPKKRWLNGRGYVGNSHFYNAIQFYGWKGFKHTILFSKLTKAEAEQKEVELIKEYKTQDHNIGYNISPGGGQFDENMRIKAKKSIKKGKGVCISSDRYKSGRITYSNIKEASEATGLSQTYIRQCCDNAVPQPRGFSIEYISDIKMCPCNVKKNFV